MGRWAQRHRRGSGTSAGVALNQIIDAEVVSDTEAQATYAQEVDSGVFSPGDFESQPSGEQSTGYANLSPTVLQIFFNFGLTTDTSLEYTGTAPGILSPQSIAY